MNWSLKSERQKYTPYGCVHIGMLNLLHRTETISLSQDRHVVCWSVEIVWPNFVTAFGFWVSWSDEFPRTYIQNCIFLPSLRTRRCVSIVLICFKFPCTWPIFSTGCFQYPRAFRRNRILHSRRTCRDSEGQVHRLLWLCHDLVLSPVLASFSQ